MLSFRTATLLAALAFATPAGATEYFVTETGAGGDAVARGAYLVHAAGCIACHTAPGGQPLAGGRAMATPFGTFHTPNITPDPETGIGRWSDADFLQALQHGLSPAGEHYYPVFPFTSYTKAAPADLLAIKAYLFAQAPVVAANKPHEIGFPFSVRLLQAGWKALFFRPGEFRPRAGAAPEVNRGAYLVQALGHCGECHTPRNPAGGLLIGLALAGTSDGPDGEAVPNITPDRETGIGGWSVDDIAELLASGTKPDFDNVQGSMGEVVEEGTAHLTAADRAAIGAYLLSLPPVRHGKPRGN
ncbi:c-type cytochrome [Zavarzinia compransoris]|uniref:c-type cytochrome n=1 Tax=Zavarzinia compransoris TaxID=1264899 RepID=UPI0010EF6E7B|nr:cytochrome c [Zavarzinia compransoris]TDP46005.1 mono/diheme cytochrome c family protein [Zavarzinia compransoris]